MQLKNLAQHPQVIRSRVVHPDTDVTELHHDSRTVASGTGFFAVKGLQNDGHQFLSDAAAKGASVLIISDSKVYEQLEKTEHAVSLILVPSGREVLAEMAAAVHGYPARQLRMLGVTGTNGKTTVSHLVSQMMAGMGRRCGVIGSLGFEAAGEKYPSSRTTPEATEIHRFLGEVLRDGLDTVCMEVTSIGIELARTHGIEFRAAAFTNLTQDHLDFHHTMEAYKESKFRLFLEQNIGAAVVNIDDVVGRELVARIKAKRPNLPLITYSAEGEADLYARKLVLDSEGCSGELVFQGETQIFRTRLLGLFNLYNLLTATGLLLAGGKDWGAVGATLSHGKAVDGRFERVELDLPFSVVVDYAHTPDALENVLVTARGLKPNRLLVVFGCGGDRDREKRSRMGTTAENLADLVILTSDNPRGERPEAILTEILEGFANPEEVVSVIDRRQAIQTAMEIAAPGDLVLIAGKGHETYQEIDGQKFPFDDRVVTREIAKTL